MKTYYKLIFFVAISIGFILLIQQNCIGQDYFTMGSTEKVVLEVQGQPSSITKIGNTKHFFYGGSSVTFENGVVEGYNNTGNLLIKINTEKSKARIDESQSNITKKKTTEKSNIVKYIYFTFLTTEYSGDVDFFSGKFKKKEHDYSKLYSISGYTYEKQESLEFCLTKNYKEWLGKEFLLIPHAFDDRKNAMLLWNNETGSIFQRGLCGQLWQIGIIEL